MIFVAGEASTYEIVGWLYVREAKRRERWEEDWWWQCDNWVTKPTFGAARPGTEAPSVASRASLKLRIQRQRV